MEREREVYFGFFSLLFSKNEMKKCFLIFFAGDFHWFLSPYFHFIMRCLDLRRPAEAVAGALAAAAAVAVAALTGAAAAAAGTAAAGATGTTAAAAAGAAEAPAAFPLSLSCSAAAMSAEAAEAEEEEEELPVSLSVSRLSLPSRAAFRTWSHSTGPARVPAGIAPPALSLLLCLFFEEEEEDGRLDSEETREGSGGKGKAASAFLLLSRFRG